VDHHQDKGARFILPHAELWKHVPRLKTTSQNIRIQAKQSSRHCIFTRRSPVFATNNNTPEPKAYNEIRREQGQSVRYPYLFMITEAPYPDIPVITPRHNLVFSETDASHCTAMSK
jgi:hypothetical protein